MYSKIGHLDLSVNVLTQGNWPTYPPAEANIPDQVCFTFDGTVM